jgi:hypothetical protein
MVSREEVKVMRPRNIVFASALILSGLLAVFALGCNSKDKSDENTITGWAIGDRTPPVTTADPRGGTRDSGVSVTLWSNEPATVYYTTNGRQPTVSDHDGTGPSPLAKIEISASTTLKFFAVDASGNVESVRTQKYVIGSGPDVTVPTTAVYPPGGTYNPPVSVTFMPDEPAKVYYTTDGSTPDKTSAVYWLPISISEDTTLTFFSVDAAGNEEAVQTEEYVITDTDVTPPTTAVYPPGGTYFYPVSVTLTPNESATVYYTRDGSTPGTGSTVYTSPIGIHGNATLMFFGVDNEGNTEAVRTVVYIITVPDETPPTTTADPPGGIFIAPLSVELTSNEPATIYYTADGREPTVSDYDGTGPNQVSGIAISESITLKFFAVDAGQDAELYIGYSPLSARPER